MLYAVLPPHCAMSIFGLLHVLYAESIALRFALVALFLAKSVRSSSALVMLTVIEEQVVTFVQLLKHPSDALLPCYFVLLAVFFWVEHDGSVVCLV